MIGSYIVLNDEGWIATAYHIVELSPQLAASAHGCRAYDSEVERITKDPTLNSQKRKLALKQLGKADKHWTRDYSFWWGASNTQLTDVRALPSVDLAIGRLQAFDPASVQQYPVLKNPDKGLPPGTSLCKLGFPFHTITPTYTAGQGFSLPVGSVPPPYFPIDGILTRNLTIGQSPIGYMYGFLETSSPGLRGQSGGPIFDSQGVVWAIQSQTAHLPLGFNPPVPGQKGQVEHQFLNVGMGVHAETLVGFLKENGIAHQLSTY